LTELSGKWSYVAAILGSLDLTDTVWQIELVALLRTPDHFRPWQAQFLREKGYQRGLVCTGAETTHKYFPTGKSRAAIAVSLWQPGGALLFAGYAFGDKGAIMESESNRNVWRWSRWRTDKSVSLLFYLRSCYSWAAMV
jgi:hypothetical protein